MTKELSKVAALFLEEIGDDAQHFLYEDGPSDYLEDTEVDTLEQKFEFEPVDAHGGEGEGDQFWTVWRVKDKETKEVAFLKFYGWYASYHGAEYTDVYEVTPQTKTVTVYE